jgi:glutamate carboxypeptidase
MTDPSLPQLRAKAAAPQEHEAGSGGEVGAEARRRRALATGLMVVACCWLLAVPTLASRLVPAAARWLSPDAQIGEAGAVYLAGILAGLGALGLAVGALARRVAAERPAVVLHRFLGDARGPAACRPSYRTLALGWIVGAGVVTAGVSMGRRSWMAGEDGAVEILQMLVLVGAICALGRAARRSPPASARRRGFVATAGLAFVLAGEEVSWGQHYLGWTTPRAWAAINAQAETNLHNLAPSQSFVHAGYELPAVALLSLLVLSAAAMASNRGPRPLVAFLPGPNLIGLVAAMIACTLLGRLGGPVPWFELAELCAYLCLLLWGLERLRGQRIALTAPPRRLVTSLALVAALVVGTLPAAGAPGATRTLDRVEARLVAHVDAHVAEARALLERVVNVNSGTQNHAGVREVGRIFEGELAALGFTTTWADGAPFGRAGHLIAERPGKGPHVLLIGHLDTVFEVDSPFQRFELLPGDRARGPGIIDMKGGDVILVQALAALRAARALDRLWVTVVLTGDEEDSGTPLAQARRDLLAAASGVDVALGFEDGDGDPRHAVVARRGSVDWRLETSGTPAHSSQIFQPEVGAGAAYEAARILNGFYTELAGEPNLTFSPGLLVGGTTAELAADLVHGSASGKANVVAGRALATGDLRTLSPEQLASAQQRMQAIAGRHLPGTEASLTFGEGYPPMAPASGNLALLAMYDQASRDLGMGEVTAVDPRRAGAADVSFVAATVPRALDALGLKGSGGHTVEETADLATLPMQTKRAALLLYRLARGLPAGGEQP